MNTTDNYKEPSKRGGIEVICGSMFSGKTEELIRRIRRAKIAKQNVEIFKPTIDVRYSDKDVVSHNRLAHAAIPVENSYSILLMSQGYDVIAIDQRGCGDNPDERVTFGINEALDVKAMVKYAKEELNASEVIVHGQSMGAQTAAIYAAGVTAGDIEAADAVICDSPVPGMELVLREMFGEDMGGMNSVPTNFLIGTSKAFMKLVYGIDYDDADTIEVASNITIPVLIIASEKDEVCLPDQVQQIYDNISGESKDILYVDSAHIEGIIDDPAGYMSSVENFLISKGL